MGYIDYLNTFNGWIEDNSPPDKVIILYYGLLSIFNRRRWPPWAGIDNRLLLTIARTSDKGVAQRARKTLAEAGFIEFVRGKRGTATKYRLLEYGGKSLPKTPPESIPESPPESTLPNKIKKKTKNKTFSGGGEGTAAPEGERAVMNFAIEHYDDINIFLGVTGEVKAKVGAITEELFSRYTTRQPTKMDLARVYTHIRSPEDCVGHISEERTGLLAQAFQKANEAGNPGNWRYIEGVLARVYQRGQTSVEEVDDFDDLWIDMRRSGGHG